MKTGTVYHGDCLDIMEQWEVSKQVDLIYPDPPFNSNHNYGAPYKGAVDKKETRPQNVFKDIWTYNDEAQERTDRICKTAAHPTRKTIQGLRVFLEDSDTEMLVYLIYMADRLWKMKDLLKPTGIVYPHCAPSANYHLRMLMDSVFGAKNFRNEIVWCYTGPINTKRWFPRKHDTILCYGKVRQDMPKRLRTEFNSEDVRIPYSEDYVKQFAKQYKERKDKSKIFAEGHDTERNQELAKQGKIPEDWWTDISPVGRIKGEYLGFSTQKPLKLLDRTIQVSNPGDLMFALFCGCGAPFAVADFKQGKSQARRWIDIDVSVFGTVAVVK